MIAETDRATLPWSATTSLVVANPAAAGVTDALLTEVIGRLGRGMPRVDVALTSRKGEAAEIAAAAAVDGAVDVIVVLGGDGTVQEVATGVLAGHGFPLGAGARPSAGHALPVRAGARPSAGHALPVRAGARPSAGHTLPVRAGIGPSAGHTLPVRAGIGASGAAPGLVATAAWTGRSPALLVLPAGSGNSTSINLWGERTCSKILDAVLASAQWDRWSIDVLHLVEPDLAVVLGASSGLLADVLIGAERVQGCTGRDRYLMAAVEVLAQPRSDPTRVTVDGMLLYDGGATVVAVGGGRRRASAFEFLPLSHLDDGLLDVCILALSGPDAIDEVTRALVNGSHLGRSDVFYAQGKQVSIERTDGRPLVAEYDGEVLAGSGERLTVEVWPAALDVVAPARRGPISFPDHALTSPPTPGATK